MDIRKNAYVINLAAAGGRETMLKSWLDGATSGGLLRVLVASVCVALVGTVGARNAMAQEHASVTIYRDTWGVPHIYSESLRGVYFGYGYAQAEDHLVPMLRNYLEATGRRAEVFGRQYLQKDYISRLFEIPKLVREGHQELDPVSRAVVEGFADGVNRYIEEHRDDVPEWVRPIAPTDVLAGALLPIFSRAQGDARSHLQGAGGRAPQGSNQWAVDSVKSASGNAMLLVDPHLPWTGLNQWYEAHLHGPGLNVAGCSFFGVPTISMGHTEHLAWSFTNNGFDTVDVYEERFDADPPTKYQYGDEWRPVRTAEIEIKVKGDARPVRRTAYYTHHGPVIERRGTTGYAVRWPGGEDVGGMAEMHRLAAAKTVDELRDLLARRRLPKWNCVAADRDGSILYVWNAKCGLKSEKYDWRRPVRGWDPGADWSELLPFERLPQVKNPPAHFLQNCNTAPWTVTPDSPLTQDRYPEYLVRGGFGPRGRRATQLLQSKEKLSMQDMIDFVTDCHVLRADELKPLIFRAYESRKDQGGDDAALLAEAIQVLRSWDNAADLDNVAMPLFKLWFNRYRELGGRLPEAEPVQFRPRDEEAAWRALLDASRQLKQTYGEVAVPWGRHHVIRRGERTVPVPGGGKDVQTLFMATGDRYEDGVWYCGSGCSFIMVIELSDPPRALSLLPFGNSEDPDSPHHSDQSVLFGQRKLKPAWFTLEDIEANLESKKVLQF
ncbi:MAG: penicillin acylase family protein [Armatimonadota bacterium]